MQTVIWGLDSFQYLPIAMEYKNFHEDFWAWPPLFSVHIVDLDIYIFYFVFLRFSIQDDH